MFGKLRDVQKIIIVNAGHWDDPHTPGIDDPGASYNHVVEQVEVAKIRDRLIPMLVDRGYEVKAVPDRLDLVKSIAWANQQAQGLNDGLAIDIHLNYLSNTEARGTEAFYGTSETSQAIATAMATHMASGLGIPNRGAKPDTQTAVGSLGWIRKTNMWATLIEVCFLSNEEDITALQSPEGYRKAAKAIADAVDYLYGVETEVENPLREYATMDLVEELQWRIRNNSL